eukprot:TRINITY_DN19320_c0_g1_i1.p1 TRINITY_DN19320_c0_g1~~TRINITY_DN19320_c0_g1_i1.p1  ORF type:complete len:461 (-),score=96.14 TRINITY_DN19320_c0_g1_i1:74-1456(-)
MNLGAVKLKPTNTNVRQATGNATIIKSTPPKPTKQPDIYKGTQTVLIISKHFVIHEWINQDIIKVLFVTESSYQTISKANPEYVKEYAHVERFEDLTSGLVEWQAEELHQKYHFTHVLVLAEEDLIRGARIRRSLGITNGQTLENALRYRDKVLMKTILRENKINVPEFAPVESATDVIQFVKEHGPQVVVKPRKGYSSTNTTIIHNTQQLQKFLNSGFNKISGFDSALDLEVETFVHGDMYHVDGLVFDNQVKVCCPSKYINICADFQNSKFLASYTLKPTNPLYKRIQEFAISCLKALGGPSCFPFHLELWVTPEDQLVFCEVASRTGGAWVRHVIRRLYDVIQDKTFSQWQVQQEISHPELGDNWDERTPDVAELAGWIFIYPKMGKIRKIPKQCPLPFVSFSETFAEVGEAFESRANCVDSVFSALFTGKEETEMIQNAEKLYNWFEGETIFDALT